MVVKRMLARIGCMLFAVLVLLNLAVTAYAQVNSGSLTLKAVSLSLIHISEPTRP